MSDPHVLSTCGDNNVDEVSASDLVAPFKLEFEKVFANMEEKWQLKIKNMKASREEREILRARLEGESRNSRVLREENEYLREETRMLKDQNKHLGVKIGHLEDEMREGEARQREKIEMLKVENIRLRRGNAELVRGMKRLLESEAARVLRNEEEMKYVEEEKGVPAEANGFNAENEGGGDGIGAGKGDDSQGGGSSSSRKASKMSDFGKSTCVSAKSTGSSDKNFVKESVISQGDGRTPLKEVEVCEIHDDVPGSGHLIGNHLSFQKPIVCVNVGFSNQEREKREHKRKRVAWKNKEDLCSDFERDDYLCLKAVCALYRQQKLAQKAMDKRICQGFNAHSVLRGNYLGEFLTDGDPQCKLKRSVEDLEDWIPRGLSESRAIALEHCNQLFAMHKKKEDPYFATD